MMNVEDALSHFCKQLEQGREPDWDFYRREVADASWSEFLQIAIDQELKWRSKNGARQSRDYYSTIDPLASDIYDTLASASQPSPDATARPAHSPPQARRVRGLLPDSIGRYKIRQAIGAGGMGEVYLAEDTLSDNRKVALKVIGSRMVTQEGIARFKAESQILASMNHENICRVYESGQTDDGEHYIAMEFVEGDTLTDACSFRQMPTQERLKLFQECCDGIQHAHNNGVIHRDIKPTNVLVTSRDGKLITKVIDFGVAKTVHANRETLRSQVGDIIGTLGYMSPEQASGKQVDTTTDVYSLGVLLFELVTGTLPHDLRKKSMVEAIRAVTEDEPIRPSSAVESSVRQSDSSVRRSKHDTSKLISALKGDLDWIILKALSKDPTRRYTSPRELSEDIERFLRGEPVSARSDSIYRLGKSLKRHAGYWSLGAATILVAIGAFVAVNNSRREAIDSRNNAVAARDAETRARKKADLATEKANQQRRIAEEAQANEEAAKQEALYEKQKAEQRAAELKAANDRLDGEPLRLRGAMARLGDLGQATAIYDAERDVADGEVNYEFDLEKPPILYPAETSSRRIQTSKVRISPDGKKLISGDLMNNFVHIWDLQSGELDAQLDGHSWVGNGVKLVNGLNGTVRAVFFNPVDAQIFYSAGLDGRLIEWNLSDAKKLREFRTAEELPITCATFGGDGTIWLGCRKGTLVGVDVESFEATFVQDRAHSEAQPKSQYTEEGSQDDLVNGIYLNQISSVAVNAGGDRLITVSAYGVVKSWTWQDDELEEEKAISLGGERLFSIALSPSDTRLAIGDGAGQLHIRDATTLEEISTIKAHGPDQYEADPARRTWEVQWINDETVASCGTEAAIRFWDAEAAELTRAFKGHGQNEWGRDAVVCFDIRKGKMASAGRDSHLRLTDLSNLTAIGTQGAADWSRSNLSGSTSRFRLSLPQAADSVYVAVDSEVVAFSLPALEVDNYWQFENEYLQEPECLVVSSNGSTALLFMDDGSAWFFGKHVPRQRLDDCHELSAIVPGVINRVAAYGLHDQFVSIADDFQLKVWNAKNGTEESHFSIRDNDLPTGAFDTEILPFGDEYVMTAGRDKHLRIWSFSKKELVTKVNIGSGITAMQWSPESNLLAVGTTSGLILLFSRSLDDISLEFVDTFVPMPKNRALVDQIIDRDLAQKAQSRQFSRVFQTQYWVAAIDSICWLGPNLIAASSGDGQISVVDASNGSLISQGFAIESKLNFLDSVNLLAIGVELYSFAQDRALRKWELAMARGMRAAVNTRVPSGPGLGLRELPGGGWLCFGVGEEGSTRAWKDGEWLKSTWLDDYGVVAGLDFSADGQQVLINPLDKPAFVLDRLTNSSTQLNTDAGVRHAAAAISPDGKLIALARNAEDDTKLAIYQAGATHLQEISMPPFVRSLSFSPDGKTLLVACDEWVIAHSVAATGVATTWYKSKMPFAPRVAFSPDSKMVVVTGSLSNSQDDRATILLETATGKEIDPIDGIAVEENEVTDAIRRRHDISELQHTLDKHLPTHSDRFSTPWLIVPGAAFSNDGTYFATCGGDGYINIWTVHGYKFSPYFRISTLDLETLGGPADATEPVSLETRVSLQHIAFSDDDTELAVVSASGILRVYNLEDIAAEKAKSPEQVREELEKLTGLRIDPHSGKLMTIPRNRLRPNTSTE